MGHITNDIQQYSKLSWGSNDYAINILPDRVQIDSNQGKVVFNAEVMSTEVKTEWIEEATDYTVVIVKMLKNVRKEIYDRIDDTKVDVKELTDYVNDYIKKTDPKIDNLFARVAEINGKYAVFVRIVENKFSEIDGRIEAIEKIIDDDKGDIKELFEQIKELKACCKIVKNKLTYLENRISNTEKAVSSVEKRIDNVETKVDNTNKRIDNVEKRVSSTEQKQKNTDANISKLWSDQKRQDAEINNVKKVQSQQSEQLNEAINKIIQHSAKLENHEKRITKLENEKPQPVPPCPPCPPHTDTPAIWHKHTSKDRVEMEYKSLTDKFTAALEYLPQRYIIVIQEETKLMKKYMYAVIRDYLARKISLWRKLKNGEHTFPRKDYIFQKVSICIVLSLAYDELVRNLKKEYKSIYNYGGAVGDRLVEIWKIQALIAVNNFLGCSQTKMNEDDIKYWLKEWAKQKAENDAIVEKQSRR